MYIFLYCVFVITLPQFGAKSGLLLTCQLRLSRFRKLDFTYFEVNSKDFTRLFLWFPYFSSSKKLYFNLKSVLLTTWFTSQRHARFDNHSLQVKTLVFICFHLVICRFWGSSCSEMRSSIRSGKQEIARFCHDLFIISKCLLRGFQRSFEPQRLPDYPLNMVGCYREQAPMVAD